MHELITIIVEFLPKVCAAALPVITLYFAVKKGFSDKSSSTRKEFLIARQLIFDIAKGKCINPFLLEKAFAAASGQDKLNSDEILYILGLNYPNQFLKKYLKARGIILCSVDSKTIAYKGRMDSLVHRRIHRYGATVIYGILAFFAIYPFLNLGFYSLNVPNLITALTLIVSSFSIAILSLLYAAKIYLAECLVNNRDGYKFTDYKEIGRCYEATL